MSKRPSTLKSASRRAEIAKALPEGSVGDHHNDAETAASTAMLNLGVDHPPAASRFRIYIIDSGWNSVARRTLHENFSVFRDLQKADPIYVLDRERSIDFIRRHATLIGKDPTIMVHDMRAIRAHGNDGFHGFRLHLGVIRKPEQALMAMQSFAYFLDIHRNAKDLEANIRSTLRQEGIAGAFEILFHGEAHPIVL